MAGDTMSAAERSALMAKIKSKNTAPEMKVRRAVHAAGFRYSLHRKELPGAPDLVFRRFKLVVFVHGCFWHWHGCKRSRMPAANRDYWEAKIARNVARDAADLAALDALGWRHFIIWECELNAGIAALLDVLSELRVSAAAQQRGG
jgi:DNA mismatch endonuclease (patch repair protein)